MKLLIIEDDQELVRNLRKGLSEEGYVVDTAFTGSAGQELAESFDFDVIILDLGLPDKDGIEVCRSLRQKKINAKILALTGRNSIADRIKELDEKAARSYRRPPPYCRTVGSGRLPQPL